jgi:colanic acid/amylovoran biosynthesis glycosyltransferase
VWPAHVRVALRRPRTWWRLARAARADQESRRRFLQAGLTADRVRRDRFDHLHAHFATAAAVVARDAAALSGRTFSVTAHAKDIFHETYAASMPERVAGAAAVVTVSGHNVEHLRGLLGPTPVAHVANGVVRPAAVSGPKSGGPVLCVARLVAKKGVDVLLDAVDLLAGELDTLRVEIIGDGPLAQELHERHPHLADRVRFLGAVASPEVEAAYSRCSMFVLPCRIAGDGDRDGMPTVIVEAMARAVPVISTDVVGIGEAVIDGQTGMLVQPDDPDAVAAAIAKLWHNPGLGEVLGANGRALVADRFDPARSARDLLDTFREAVR